MAFGVLDPTSWCGCARPPPQITTCAAQDFWGMAPTVRLQMKKAIILYLASVFTAKKKKEQGIANKKWSVPRLRRA